MTTQLLKTFKPINRKIEYRIQNYTEITLNLLTYIEKKLLNFISSPNLKSLTKD